MIQILEDLLRAYVLNLKGNWDDHLPLVELPIITVFRLVMGCHLLRGCMVGDVGLLFVRMM